MNRSRVGTKSGKYREVSEIAVEGQRRQGSSWEAFKIDLWVAWVKKNDSRNFRECINLVMQ